MSPSRPDTDHHVRRPGSSDLRGGRRLARERRTVEAMIAICCQAYHGEHDGLCPDCQRLAGYARHRLEHCRYGSSKPTCARCPVHCYAPEMRQRIRAVMRFAGPRMLWRHPLLAMQHLLDGLRPTPTRMPGKS